MKLGLLQSLDPTLKQTVRGFTNKNPDKTLDVLLMDCQDLYQVPTILPPMTVDEGKVGKDSDHSGVECLPRSNLAPAGSRLRQEVKVRPFPDSGLAVFGCRLQEEDWSKLRDCESSSEVVASFESRSAEMVDCQFPVKTIQVGPHDLPYFTEELRKLKRRRQRAYRKGKRSEQYRRSKEAFESRKVKEATKYRNKIIEEVREGKRTSGYRAIRKLGDRPGEEGRSEVVLSSMWS